MKYWILKWERSNHDNIQHDYMGSTNRIVNSGSGLFAIKDKLDFKKYVRSEIVNPNTTGSYYFEFITKEQYEKQKTSLNREKAIIKLFKQSQ